MLKYVAIIYRIRTQKSPPPKNWFKILKTAFDSVLANPVVRPNGVAPTAEPDENIRQPNVTNCTISCSTKRKQEENEL